MIMDIQTVLTYFNECVCLCCVAVSPPSECPMHQAQPVKGRCLHVMAKWMINYSVLLKQHRSEHTDRSR